MRPTTRGRHCSVLTEEHVDVRVCYIVNDSDLGSPLATEGDVQEAENEDITRARPATKLPQLPEEYVDVRVCDGGRTAHRLDRCPRSS